MRTRTYNQMIRDFSNWADTMNRVLETGNAPYDYTRNGGSQEANSTQEAGGDQDRTPGNVQTGTRTLRLPIDVWQEGETFKLNACLPGVDPESVQITWENDELLIQGEMPAPAAEEGWLRRELFHGRFERRVGFNIAVDADNIEADYHNGLLTLTLPKAEAIRPKQIKVQAR